PPILVVPHRPPPACARESHRRTGRLRSLAESTRIIPRTSFVFDKLQGTQSQTITVAQHIDVGPFQEVDLVIRVHTAIINAGCNITIAVLLDGWTAEDPAASFTQANDFSGTALLSYGIGAAPTTPLVQVYPVGSTVQKPFGRLLTITVTGLQPSTPTSC